MWQERREGYPTYGQENPLRPVPRYLFLDWSQATQKGSGNNQYQQWTWKTKDMIEGFNYCSLMAISYQTTTFTPQPTFLGIRINEFSNINLGTSNFNPTDGPTWMVPNTVNAPATTLAYSEGGSKDEYLAEIRNVNTDTLTVSFLNETLNLVPTVAVPPGPHFFYLYLKLWN
jgi:hypothetical protein